MTLAFRIGGFSYWHCPLRLLSTYVCKQGAGVHFRWHTRDWIRVLPTEGMMTWCTCMYAACTYRHTCVCVYTHVFIRRVFWPEDPGLRMIVALSILSCQSPDQSWFSKSGQPISDSRGCGKDLCKNPQTLGYRSTKNSPWDWKQNTLSLDLEENLWYWGAILRNE